MELDKISSAFKEKLKECENLKNQFHKIEGFLQER